MRSTNCSLSCSSAATFCFRESLTRPSMCSHGTHLIFRWTHGPPNRLSLHFEAKELKVWILGVRLNNYFDFTSSACLARYGDMCTSRWWMRGSRVCIDAD